MMPMAKVKVLKSTSEFDDEVAGSDGRFVEPPVEEIDDGISEREEKDEERATTAADDEEEENRIAAVEDRVRAEPPVIDGIVTV